MGSAGGLGAGVLEIAMALIGVALVALLVGNSKNAGSLVQTAGSTFGDLLKIVTLQNGFGVGSFNNGSMM